MSPTSAVQFTCVCSLGLNADAQTADFTLRATLNKAKKWTQQPSEQDSKENEKTSEWYKAQEVCHLWDSLMMLKQLLMRAECDSSEHK